MMVQTTEMVSRPRVTMLANSGDPLID